MSGWSISVDPSHGDAADVLATELAESDDGDVALKEAAITAALPLLSLIGDASVDDNVKVRLSGDNERKVTIVVESVPSNKEDNEAKQRNDNLGLVNASTPPEALLDDAQLRAEDLDNEVMRAQFHATGSLLPEDGEASVVDRDKVYEAADVMRERDKHLEDSEPAQIELGEVMRSVADALPETPYDPADYKASTYADGSLSTYSVDELRAIRVAEENGKNRKTVLAHIDAAVSEKQKGEDQ